MSEHNLNEILDGLLIGDSFLQNRSRTPRGRPYFGHNCVEPEFVGYVVSTLSSLGLEFGPTHQKPNGYGTGMTTQVYSHVSDLLRDPWKRWYPEGQKILPVDLVLTPIIARLWYCGDGGLDSDKGYLRQLCFSAHSFPLEDRERLSGMLRESGFRSRNTKRGLICISKKSIPSFLDWLGPSPTACYQYKWDLSRFTGKQPKYC